MVSVSIDINIELLTNCRLKLAYF